MSRASRARSRSKPCPIRSRGPGRNGPGLWPFWTRFRRFSGQEPPSSSPAASRRAGPPSRAPESVAGMSGMRTQNRTRRSPCHSRSAKDAAPRRAAPSLAVSGADHALPGPKGRAPGSLPQAGTPCRSVARVAAGANSGRSGPSASRAGRGRSPPPLCPARAKLRPSSRFDVKLPSIRTGTPAPRIRGKGKACYSEFSGSGDACSIDPLRPSPARVRHRSAFFDPNAFSSRSPGTAACRYPSRCDLLGPGPRDRGPFVPVYRARLAARHIHVS